MPCIVDRRKREISMTPNLARDMAIHAPIHERLTHEVRLARPPHLQCPALVTNPVRDPVVRAGIDEHAHAALEELSDVVRVLV